MKKLILIICAILTLQAVNAQNQAKISGRFLNFPHSRIDFWFSSGTKNKYLHQSPPQSVAVAKDGSFSLTVSDMAEPFEISFYAPNIGPNVLFFANGYDLHITADASNINAFRRTLAISGKGSGINSFWLKLNNYRLKHATQNWYKKDENAYLNHLTDSIKTVSALIASIDETDNDSHKEFLKEALQRDLKMMSVRSLYNYSFSNQYTYDQTQNLLKKAGFPDGRNYVGRGFEFENFPIPGMRWWGPLPEKFEKRDSLQLEQYGNVSMRRDWFYKSHPDHPIIRARVEQAVRENVNYASQIREKEGNRVNAYAGYPFRQYTHVGPNLSSLIIDGKNYIELAGEGISEKNAADYRYRIIRNGNQLSGWTRPSQFTTTRDGKMRYAYFGKFVYKEGQMITLEVENIKDPSVNDMLLMDWRPLKKAVIGFDINYTTEGEKTGQKRLTSKSLQESMITYPAAPSFIIASAPDIRFRLGDSLQSLSFTVKNKPENYDYDIILKQKTSGATTTTHMGKTNTHFVIDKFYWEQPGEYEVTFIPRLYKLGYPYNDFAKDFTAQAETITFTVMPALKPISFSLRSVLMIIAAFIVCSIVIFYIYRSRQLKLVQHEQQQKELATLQLRSVRSQLNPHFMYNALAGIQNLMNRNETDAANLYLSKFARLTRSVLDDNEKDLVTVSSEIDLLRDYLEMEKMRFGFAYTFEIDPELDQANTDIPAMLLQPFVENAVKHAAAESGEAGLIIIRFRKHDKNLILQVQDNGRGGKIDEKKGKGIKLSRNRIDLYNRLYKETAIVLSINKDKDGTRVTIELKDWI